jgi:amidase
LSRQKSIEKITEHYMSKPGDLTRREFMKRTGVLAGAIEAGSMIAKSSAAEAALPVPDLVMMNAIDLSRAIHFRKLSCIEVMSAYLDHIGQVNAKVNAIVSLQERDSLMRQAAERDAQLSRGESMGWMHGFPHAVKDLAATKGIRTTWGSPLFDTIPQVDAIFVERLRKCGVILIGKTNAPEMGLGSQTYNPIFGITRNAYDHSKAAGGSSGGAAVGLATRMLPVADGSDMMGSLRNPAAFNNVFGFRPSFGRVPSAGEDVFLETLSCSGPMGRTVTDVAMLLSVMAGHDSRAPLSIDQDPAIFAEPLKRDFKGTRIAWLGNFNGYLQIQPDVLRLCRESFKAFESIGCSVEEARPDYPPEKVWQCWLTLRHWSMAGELATLYKDPAKRAQMKPEVQWEIEGGLPLTALEVSNASLARTEWYWSVHRLFEKYDFLLLPSAQVFPFDAELHWPQEINGVKMDTYHRWMEVVLTATLTGAPALSVPVGFNSDGLAMGMQIIGKNHADLAVLQLGYAYDEATHWVRDRKPPLLNDNSV